MKRLLAVLSSVLFVLWVFLTFLGLSSKIEKTVETGPQWMEHALAILGVLIILAGVSIMSHGSSWDMGLSSALIGLLVYWSAEGESLIWIGGLSAWCTFRLGRGIILAYKAKCRLEKAEELV